MAIWARRPRRPSRLFSSRAAKGLSPSLSADDATSPPGSQNLEVRTSIPGPVDEVILVFIAPVLFVFYREPMRDAWDRADGPSSAARFAYRRWASPRHPRHVITGRCVGGPSSPSAEGVEGSGQLDPRRVA